MLQHYKQLIPVLFLAVCSFITVATAIQGNIILDGDSYDFAPTINHYGGMVTIGLAVAAFFRFHSFYKYVLAATFLLGLCRIINFTPTNYSFGLGYEESRFQLDLIALAFGLLVYWTNATKINLAVFGAMKPSAKKAKRINLVEIEEFKDKFSQKTTEQLTHIVTAKTLVPAALAAARQLLEERQ